MAGKRQRALRRTVSASTMGSGCNIFESSPLLKYSKEKQKFPVLSSYCPHGMLASTNLDGHNPTKASSFKSNPNANAISLTQSEAPSQALPLLHKFNKPPSTLPSSSWNRSERKSVGLGVVAAFSDESRAMTEVKDGKNEAPPHVVSKNSIMEPVSFNFPHHSALMQGRSAVFLHELPCKDVDYNDRTSMALPAADFLEACYFCKRRLSHGFDIYMYRGDQAFCSEECRYEQIVLDERKEKCSLQALKMKTSAPSFRSTDQRTQGMTSGTVAAG